MKNIAKISIAACAFFTLFGSVAAEKINVADSRSSYSNNTLMLAATNEKDLEKELQRNRAEQAKLDQERQQLKKEKAERAKIAAGKQYKEGHDCRETGKDKNGVVTIKCSPQKDRKQMEKEKAEHAKVAAGKQYKEGHDCRQTGKNKNGVITIKCTPHKNKRPKFYSTDAERQRAERGKRDKD